MKKLLSALLCFLLAGCVVSSSVFVASSAQTSDAPVAATGETRNEDIINGNSYNLYTDVVRTYLCTTDSGFMRIYGMDNGTLFAEYYDQNYQFVSNRIVSVGLPLFGGFYESDSYYFVITGDTNREEDDNKEVIRITRFTKDWKNPRSASIYGSNTTVPFDAGRCDFAPYGDLLIIRTTHEIYGIYSEELDRYINHQTNMTIVLDMKRLYVKDYFTDVANILTAGFASHSFNQFVAVDSDGTVVCLDHGDEHPRTASLGRFLTKADNLIIYKEAMPGVGYQTFEFTPTVVYAVPEEGFFNPYYNYISNNITGGMIGGLEISSSSYLTVGTSVVQDDDFWLRTAFNAYISVTDKTNKDITKAENRIIFLTSFTEDDGRYATNPQLVKINSNRFLVMWNEFPVEKYIVGVEREYTEDYVMKYVFVDGKGSLLSDIMTAPYESGAYVSECEPIVRNNKILWYVSDGKSESSIIEIDAGTGALTAHEHVVPETFFNYPINLSHVIVSFRSFERIPSTVNITADNLDQYIVVTYQGRPLVRGRDYVLRYDDSGANPITVTTSNGYITRVKLSITTVSGYSYLPLSYSYHWTVQSGTHYFSGNYAEEDGVHLKITAMRGVGYYIYRNDTGPNGTYTLIGSVNSNSISEYVDTTAERGKVYYYVVREFTFDEKGNEILSDPNRYVAVATLDPDPTEPPPTEPPTEAPTDPPTEPPTEAPTDPPTEPPTEPSVVLILLGDADRDTEVTILDATKIQRVLAGLTSSSSINPEAADADRDGEVSILDATSIQRALAGLPTRYPVGKWVDPATL